MIYIILCNKTGRYIGVFHKSAQSKVPTYEIRRQYEDGTIQREDVQLCDNYILLASLDRLLNNIDLIQPKEYEKVINQILQKKSIFYGRSFLEILEYVTKDINSLVGSVFILSMILLVKNKKPNSLQHFKLDSHSFFMSCKKKFQLLFKPNFFKHQYKLMNNLNCSYEKFYRAFDQDYIQSTMNTNSYPKAYVINRFEKRELLVHFYDFQYDKYYDKKTLAYDSYFSYLIADEMKSAVELNLQIYQLGSLIKNLLKIDQSKFYGLLSKVKFDFMEKLLDNYINKSNGQSIEIGNMQDLNYLIGESNNAVNFIVTEILNTILHRGFMELKNKIIALERVMEITNRKLQTKIQNSISSKDEKQKIIKEINRKLTGHDSIIKYYCKIRKIIEQYNKNYKQWYNDDQKHNNCKQCKMVKPMFKNIKLLCSIGTFLGIMEWINGKNTHKNKDSTVKNEMP